MSCRAICFAHKRDFANALKDFDDAVRIEPTTANIFANRGITKTVLEDYNGAIRDFTEAIRHGPEDKRLPICYLNRGNAKFFIGDLEGAMKDFDESIKLNPNNAGTHYSRGALNTKLKHYIEAIIDFSNMIQLNPVDADGHSARAQVRFELADVSGAIKDYDQALLLNPNDPNTLGNRGESKLYSGDVKGAIADYDVALSLDPDLEWVYNARGYAKVASKDYESALADFERSIELNPKETSSYCNISVIHACCPIASLRNADKAIDAAESARLLEPNNPKVFDAKACALALRGDYEGAIEWQRKAMADEAWMKEQTLKGDNRAEACIAKWKAKELWLLPE